MTHLGETDTPQLLETLSSGACSHQGSTTGRDPPMAGFANGNCHVDAAGAQFIIGVDKMHTEMQQSMLVSRHRMAREGEIGCYVGGQQREHSSSTYL